VDVVRVIGDVCCSFSY